MSVFTSAYTLLGFGRVILGSVRSLGHVWAGLRCHTGFHGVTFTLPFLVVFWASTGNICYVVLQRKRDAFIQTDCILSVRYMRSDQFWSRIGAASKHMCTVSIPSAFIWSALFSAIVKNFFGSDRASTIAETQRDVEDFVMSLVGWMNNPTLKCVIQCKLCMTQLCVPVYVHSSLLIKSEIIFTSCLNNRY